ncbi:uncharacterized protein J3R85_008138 [Psidium guajava]|nr:uncharacterized protein J3R85_008138 [Psidium guajava]
MLDVWSWICELPDSVAWAKPESSSPQVFELASSKTGHSGAARSILIRTDQTSRPGSEPSVTFAVLACGFQESGEERTLWVSDACPLSSDKPFLPLLLQLLRETISRSPTLRESSCPRSQLQKLRPDPVSWIMDSHSPESLSSFFNLVFLTRMFWACSFDAPSEVGSFYFESLLAPNLEALSCKHAPVLRTFLWSVGIDAEVCFMRTLGYMLAKWLILREVGVGLRALTPLPVQGLSFSYATEAHGLWILKGYSPVAAMKLTRSNDHMKKFPVIEAKDSILKYVLAHQQLEAVVQFEYSVKFCEGYIQVNTCVDNIRLHVVNLGFGKESSGGDAAFAGERHFPSRVRVWVGPEVGATYVGGLSLGRSTSNGERELETQRVMKSTFGKSKAKEVKAAGKTSTRVRLRSWRWDQDSEGNAVVLDGVLCDNTTGEEVAAWLPPSSGGGGDGFRRRYAAANRPFTKSGGLVFAGDEYGESVGWRLNREMEGSVLKWRIGGQVWLSYLANDVKSSHFETRVVEWCDEIDLPLIPGKLA